MCGHILPRPVERECVCPGGPRDPGPENHEPGCNDAYAELFFGTVAALRESFRQPAPAIPLHSVTLN